MTAPLPLKDLAPAAGELLVRIDGDETTTVSDVAYDSRAVREGDLFFCVPGAVSDGHEWAGHAARAGVTGES